MRVLFFNNDYWPSLGGVEVQTRNLAIGLRDRGHEVAVAANRIGRHAPAQEIVDGIEVRRFAFNQAIATRDEKVIADVVTEVVAFKRAFRPNLVHVNVPGTAQIYHLRTSSPDHVSVVVFHCAIDDWPGIWNVARDLAARSAAIVVPSHFLAGNVAEVLQWPPQEIHVIEHGIAAERLLAVPPLAEPLPPRFLFSARLVALKGPGIAIGAMGLLGERGIAAELLMAGSGVAADELAALAARPKYAGRVTLLGQLPQDELARRLGEVTAQVVPSRSRESFSLVSAEAAFAARPVLASRHGGLVETIVDGETGLLFEPGNRAALADAMQRLLQEPGLAMRLGNAARERARRRYPLSMMIDRYEMLYRDLLNGLARRPA